MSIRSLIAAVFLACHLAPPATAQDEEAIFLRALPFEAVVAGGLGEIGDLQGTPLEERVLDTFREKAMTDPQSVGLGPGAAEVLDALRPAGPAFRNGKVALVKLRQDWRGIPIHGDAADLVLILGEDGAITGMRGRLYDGSEEMSGGAAPISTLRGRRAVALRWREDGGDTAFRIENLQLVALLEEGRLAWRGRITLPFMQTSRRTAGVVLVDAISGALIAIEDRPAEARALVTHVDDDPRDTEVVLRDGLVSKPLDNTLDFSAADGVDCGNGAWRAVRLGDGTRRSLLSFEGTDGSSFRHFTTARCASGGAEAPFTGGSEGPADELPLQVYAQDLFAKTETALALIDPLMGELFTHGTTHPYSWDHHPGTPDIAHRPPLVNVVDASSDWMSNAPGIFHHIRVAETDAAVADLPIAHPLVVHCRNGSGVQVDCGSPGAGVPAVDVAFMGVSAATPFQTRTLLHEIGHYYDMYNSFGISGENGEIIPQLFALYLSKRIYDLDYQITSNPDLTCDLAALISHSAGQVVHPDCISNFDQISQVASFSGPYTVQSFTQGYWSLLHATSCEIAGGALSCETGAGAPPEYPDRWMEALLFAMQAGNELSLTEIWDLMAVFIAANYPQDNQRLARARALHGLD